MYVHINIKICTFIFILIFYLYSYSYIYIHNCTYLYVLYLYSYTHIYTRIDLYVFVHVCTNLYICLFMYVCISIYLCTYGTIEGVSNPILCSATHERLLQSPSLAALTALRNPAPFSALLEPCSTVRNLQVYMKSITQERKKLKRHF